MNKINLVFVLAIAFALFVCASGAVSATIYVPDGMNTENVDNTISNNISTADGVELALSDDGEVAGLRIAGTQLVNISEAAFNIRDLTPDYTPDNLLPSPSFEQVTGDVPDGWEVRNYKQNTGELNITVDNTTAQTGSNSIRMHINSTDGVDGMALVAERNITVEGGQDYVSTAFVKTEFGFLAPLETGWKNYYVGMRLVWYGNQSKEIGDTICSVTRTVHDWKQFRWDFTSPPGAETAVLGVYVEGINPDTARGPNATTVWFDDLAFYPLPQNETVQAVTGNIVPSDGVLIQTASLADEGLNLSAQYIPHDRYIEVTAMVEDTTGRDRALDVSFGIPINATGWRWYDDIRTCRQVTGEGDIYQHVVNAEKGGWLPNSMYHTSALVNEELGIALAIPLSQPRVFHIAYDADAPRFSITFSLGLSASTVKFPSQANFTVYLYKIDEPEWGFRSAVQKYYELFPDYFTVKNPLGLDYYKPYLNATHPLAAYGVRGITDHFHLPNKSAIIPIANGNNTFVTQHIHPFNFGPATSVSIDDPAPSYEYLMAFMESATESEKLNTRTTARGAMNSTVEGSNGEFIIDWIKLGAGWAGDVWIPKIPQNLDPELPPDNMAQIHIDWWIEPAFDNAEAAGGVFNGILIDNFMKNAFFVDMNASRFQYADYPLTYDSHTHGVGIQTGATSIEFLEFLQDWVSNRQPNLTLSANCFHDGPAMFGFPYLSNLQFEMNSVDKWGGVRMNFEDADLNFRRVMARHRILGADQCGSMFDDDGHLIIDRVEDFANRSVFYGIYPGMKKEFFEHGEENCSPALPVYQKVLPILDNLTDAGWEVITHAYTSDPDVYIERFGPTDEDWLYFTVYNSANTSSTADIHVSLDEMGYKNTELEIDELMTGNAGTWTPEGDGMRTNVTLDAGRTLVFRINFSFYPEKAIFDTGSGTYPSIFGTHNGTIKPNVTIDVFKLYTYPCPGTGGHTEYARIWNATLDVNATWKGYVGDYHNISFDKFTLVANETYNYTIRTGSYPQILHTDELEVASGAGTITCDKFIDVNGKVYYNWIPAIRLWR